MSFSIQPPRVRAEWVAATAFVIVVGGIGLWILGKTLRQDASQSSPDVAASSSQAVEKRENPATGTNGPQTHDQPETEDRTTPLEEPPPAELPVEATPLEQEALESEQVSCDRGEYLELARALSGPVELFIDYLELGGLLEGFDQKLYDTVEDVEAEFRRIAKEARTESIRLAATAAARRWGRAPKEFYLPIYDDPEGLLITFFMAGWNESRLGAWTKLLDEVQADCWTRIMSCVDSIWRDQPRSASLAEVSLTPDPRTRDRATLHLRNTSGGTLHHATIAIDFERVGAPSITTHFYFDGWASEDVVLVSASPRLYHGGWLVAQARVSVWSDEAVQEYQVFEFSDRRAYLEERQRRASAAEAQKINLQALIGSGRQFSGVWKLGVHLGPLGIDFLPAPESKGRRGYPEVRIYDPAEPAVFKDFDATVRLDRSESRYVLGLERHRSGGIDGRLTRKPSTTNFLRKRDKRTIHIYPDGEALRGISSIGNEVLLYETSPATRTEIERLRVQGFEHPSRPLEGQLRPIPQELLPRVELPSIKRRASSVGEVDRWDAHPKPFPSIAWPTVEQIEIDRTETVLFCLRHRELMAWNLRDDRMLFETYERRSFALTPDQKHVFRVASRTHRLDARSGRTVGPEKRPGELRLAQFTPDGRLLGVANSNGKEIVTYSPSGEAQPPLFKQTGDVLAMAVSPDGQHLFAASSTDQINIWSLATGSNAGRLLGAADVRQIHVSPDSPRVLTVAQGKKGGKAYLRIWNLETLRPVYRAELGRSPRAIAIAPDWRRALVAERGDARVRLWDLVRGREVHAFVGHQLAASAVAFSSDGQVGWSGGTDAWVIQWMLPPLE